MIGEQLVFRLAVLRYPRLQQRWCRRTHLSYSVHARTFGCGATCLVHARAHAASWSTRLRPSRSQRIRGTYPRARKQSEALLDGHHREQRAPDPLFRGGARL